MTYFFNQTRLKCKERHPIKIDDVHINIKPISHDNVDVVRENENLGKSNSDVIDLSSHVQKVIVDVPSPSKLESSNSQFNLQKSFKKWCKISLTLIPELVEFLNDRRLFLSHCFVKIYIDLDELKRDSFYICSSSHDDSKSELIRPNMQSSINDRKLNLFLANVKDKAAIPGPSITIPECKFNTPSIQFLLSSEKSSNLIQDIDFHLTCSTIEWVITKLTASIKHKDIIQEIEKKNANNTKPKLIFYGDNPKETFVTDIYENAKSLIEILKCLSTSLNVCCDNIVKLDKRVLDVCSNDGTRSIMYPSGYLAILYCQTEDHYLLQVFNDISNEIIAQFSNSFGGMVFWSENSYPRVIIEQGGCKIFNLDSEILRFMKWPANPNNKLAHSINIRFNPCVSFHCSAKDSIFIKFESNEDKNKLIEIKIHNWLFKECKFKSEKKCLLANIAYSSQTANELMKLASTKQYKKEDIQKNIESKSQLDVKLTDLKSCIRSNFENWIDFIKNRVQFGGQLIQRQASKSASINRGQAKTFQIGSTEIGSVLVQRNISAPLRQLNVEKPLFLQNKSYSRRLKSAVEPKETFSGSVVCPLKIRSGLLNKCSYDFQTELLSPETCLCSKSQVSEITDLELSNFLNVVNSNQLIIIGVITSQNDIKSEERLKEKFIEESLSALLSDLYDEDLKKSTQKPCQTYHHKAYRLFFYDIKSSGRFLNSTQSLLLRKHNILPGMCLMFKGYKLLFADYIFNGYKLTKKDLFKQINLSQNLFENGFYLPNDFQLSFNNKSKQWIEETAYSKIRAYNCKVEQDELSSI